MENIIDLELKYRLSVKKKYLNKIYWKKRGKNSVWVLLKLFGFGIGEKIVIKK